MSQESNVNTIDIGYHPKGFRIDKTALPLDRYTQWEIDSDGKWVNPKPVCFHSFPVNGWIRSNGFE